MGELNATGLEGDLITYEFTTGLGDGNNSLFTLESNGTLRTNTALDYELGTPLRVRILARNENGDTEEASEVEVEDVFEPEQPTYAVDSAANLEMLWVEPGTFTMGHGESGTAFPEHNVTITRGYYLGKYEVTQAEYQAVMAGNELGLSSTPSNFSGFPTDRSKRSYDDIIVFLESLNQTEALNCRWMGLCTAHGGTVGIAARADTITAYPWGDDINSSHAITIGMEPNDGVDFQRTRDAGQYPANPWGFYDLQGNVWEWVADRMGDYTADPRLTPKVRKKGILL